MNSRLDLRNDISAKILKICIGGAFFPKYAKADYKNSDQLKRVKTSGFLTHDQLTRALLLNDMPEHINEDHLHQYFTTKICEVEKVYQIDGKPLIVFTETLHEKRLLKACMKMGFKPRIRQYAEKPLEDPSIVQEARGKNKEVQYSYDEIRYQLDRGELKRPMHLFELRFEAITKEAFLDFELESINNFTAEFDEKKIEHVTFACQSFYDKGGRYTCRNGTKLPDVPDVDALFTLLFAPRVNVLADNSKSYFAMIEAEGGIEIPLTRILTH